MKVMVVDDDALTIQVLEATLEQLGHEVVVHRDATGVMSSLMTQKPDVAVIDVRMPGLGGEKLARVVVTNQPATIVILHSGLPEPQLRQLADQAGVAGYIEKSADPRKFALSFERIVSSRRHTSRVRSPA